MNFLKDFFTNTSTITLTVSSPNGFHLRPIAKFTNSIKSINGELTASYNNKSVNAKNTTSLLSLSLEYNQSFTLTLKSKNSKEEIDNIAQIFYDIMSSDTPNEGQENSKVISHGIGIGNTYNLAVAHIDKKTNIPFSKALEMAIDSLNSNDIFLAQQELLKSTSHQSNSLEELEEKINHEFKLTQKSDYLDILQVVKKHMGLETQINYPDEPFILLANDLLPSQIEDLSKTNVQGVVLKETSPTSHSAILLRSFSIPAIINDNIKTQNNIPAILDTKNNNLTMNPTDAQLNSARNEIQNINAKKEMETNNKFNDSITKNGIHVDVVANITDLHSAQEALESGAKSVGLLRTEFMFKEKKPTLNEQIEQYSKIFKLFDYVTVRTLDVGGDKGLPYINISHENNPFLGIRGVRLLKTHSDIIQTQIRAILRASSNNHIKLMFPMVSTISEFKDIKNLAINIAKEESISLEKIEFGIMLEVPSIIYQMHELNNLVDFYSIGTNDLFQYMFAIDRTHKILSIDDESQTIINILEDIYKKSSKPISICGEIASNQKITKQLIDIGYKTLSVSPSLIPSIKEKVRDV